MSVTARFVQDGHEAVAATTICGSQLSTDSERALFVSSVGAYLDIPFRFFIVGPLPFVSRETVGAAGLITFVTAPMHEELFLLLECIWTDGSTEVDEAVWSLLEDFARRLDFAGICIPAAAPGAMALLRRELTDIQLRNLRANGFPVQLALGGVWTSLVSGPSVTSALMADCFVLLTLPEPEEAQGVAVDSTVTTAYRGEGRLAYGAYSSCQTLDELVEQVAREGFRPRVTLDFSGRLSEQFLHQGYVDQCAVSLTTSGPVACLYATAGHSRDKGVVFTVDVSHLTADRIVFDGIQTLLTHVDWMFPSEFDLLERILTVLGLRNGGRFLEAIYTSTMDRVRIGKEAEEAITGLSTRLEAVPSEMMALLRSRVNAAELDGFLQGLEQYWGLAIGKVGSLETIGQGGETAETRSMLRKPFLYEKAFQQVADQLTDALATRGSQSDRRRGWDLTAFGYMAKTLLDHELFVPGVIEPQHVRSASIVDREGRPLRVIPLNAMP